MKLKELVFSITTPCVVFVLRHKGQVINFKRNDLLCNINPELEKLLNREVQIIEVANGRLAPYFTITMREV